MVSSSEIAYNIGQALEDGFIDLYSVFNINYEGENLNV